MSPLSALPGELAPSALAGVPAMILVGGLGTRLQSVVADRPKPLAPVLGHPFLQYLLELLASAGVEQAIMCAGHRGAMVEAAFGAAYGSLEIRYSLEETLLGTAGALRQALPLIDGEDSVLVMNGDSFCDVDLAAFAAHHRASGSRASLVLTEVPDTARYGRVELDGAGRVRSFSEKSATAGAGLINAGVYLFDPALLATIPPGEPASLERDFFPAWLQEGLSGYPVQGAFLDIGTPESYAQATHFFQGRLQR